ncbi:Acid phosphatase [Mycena venus]|uniref:Acid phosphatase n=1 Tax=Mycena venus TaxID=2733690 RepID=A0A8H6X3S7_9AGAR|nr:Acid phosphatase [Mycena venus]
MPNSTLKDKVTCKGKAFNRIIEVWLKNTETDFTSLAEQGIRLTNYNSVIGTSLISAWADVAASGGDLFGMHDDNTYHIPPNISTVVDLVKDKGFSWATYQENMPADEFHGFNYNAKNYISPSSADNPYYVNDARDTTIDFAASFLEYWLPLLSNPRVNDGGALVLLIFDETETYIIQNNMFAILLGGAVPVNLRGTTDDKLSTHYSSLSPVQADWELESLGRQALRECTFSCFLLHSILPVLPISSSFPLRSLSFAFLSGPSSSIRFGMRIRIYADDAYHSAVSNVFYFIAAKTGYKNVKVPADQVPQFNLTGVTSGALTSASFVPFAAPNLKARGAGGGTVLTRPGLNTKLTAVSLPSPVNMLALNKTTPWMSPRTTSGTSIIPCADADCA